MTATRDRQSDPDTEHAPATAWDERPIFGTFRGLTWWAAVLLALGVTAAAAAIDMVRQNKLSPVFQGAYFVGCVAAVCWVRRRSLFGPMVQPPLILALTVPTVVYLASGAPIGNSLFSKVLTLGTPLINGFPTMAITTGATILIGVLRLYLQRDPAVVARNRAAEERTRKVATRPDEDGDRPPRQRGGGGRPPQGEPRSGGPRGRGAPDRDERGGPANPPRRGGAGGQAGGRPARDDQGPAGRGRGRQSPPRRPRGGEYR
ncbi:hypothetical protein EV193_101269 [Herbihabitans rhizosphaerae]|uniref:DUF6542 domain-containing protein n=1 Tax=Herbihabitans rhizosphaerae TaxID=1872711 RepID=A0A4V2EUF5_9PSEU|nr:DUF6542 domain-containing protein [Herbihabitans rhizosphaerae]RZS44393.1 hypothetical protein EV193_101269 [Herbihabitans rhizosphaerae]